MLYYKLNIEIQLLAYSEALPQSSFQHHLNKKPGFMNPPKGLLLESQKLNNNPEITKYT